MKKIAKGLVLVAAIWFASKGIGFELGQRIVKIGMQS